MALERGSARLQIRVQRRRGVLSIGCDTGAIAGVCCKRVTKAIHSQAPILTEKINLPKNVAANTRREAFKMTRDGSIRRRILRITAASVPNAFLILI